MTDNGENPVVAAFKYVFVPLIELSNKLPPVLAYGLAVLIAFLVTVIVGAVIPNNLLWALIVVVIVVLVAFIFVDWRERGQDSSVPPPFDDSVLQVVVHEQSDQTCLIPDAQVTLALPEPMVKITNPNGATTFIFSNQHIGKDFALNARRSDYRKREPVRIVLRRNAYEFIPLEPKHVSGKELEVNDECSEQKLEELSEDPKAIYESQSEEAPFITWGLFATDGRFRNHISIIRRPADGLATFDLKAGSDVLVGVNKSLRVLYGRVEFEYKVIHSSAEGPNVFFYMIPIQETGPGRTGLIEVGTNVEHDARNAFSSYRQKFVVPIEHFGDDKWHRSGLDFDFRYTPEAFYSIFGPRINEGAVHPGAAHLMFANVKVFSDEI